MHLGAVWRTGERTNRQRLLVSKGRVVWEEKTWKKRISELDVHWSNYSYNFKYIFQYHSITKYVWANQTSFLGYKTCWGERGVDHVVARAPKLGKTHLQYIVGRHSNHMFAWWFLDICWCLWIFSGFKHRLESFFAHFFAHGFNGFPISPWLQSAEVDLRLVGTKYAAGKISDIEVKWGYQEGETTANGHDVGNEALLDDMDIIWV